MSLSGAHPDLADLARRIRADGAGGLLLDESPLPFDPDEPVRSLDAVAFRLYEQWYCRTDDFVPDMDEAAYRAATEALLAGRDRWSRDWPVRTLLDDGTVLVEKGAQRAWVPAGGYVLRNPLCFTMAGAKVDLFQPGHNDGLQDAFIHVFGRTPHENAPGLDLVRIYLSFPPQALADCLAAAIAALDLYFIPFRLKFLRRAEDFARADTAVLYLERRHVPLATSLLVDRSPQGGRSGPRLVHKIGAGIGIAEDPPGGASFGLDRSHLLAFAFSKLLGRRTATPRAVAAAIETELNAGGVDPARPWRYETPHGPKDEYRRYMGLPVPE